MKRYTKAKLIAAVILMIPYAIYTHYYRASMQQMGRDAFLAHEAKRWDMFLAHSSPVTEISFAVLALGVLLLVYEVLAAVVSRFVSDDPPDEPTI